MTIFDELHARRHRIDDETLQKAYGASISTLQDAGIRDREDLRRALVSPEGADHRPTVIWAAGELEMRDAIPSVWSALMEDPNMAFEAAKAILKMAPAEASTLNGFSAILGTPQMPTVARTAAAHALGVIGSGLAADDLTGILADPREDPSLRSHCAEALGSIRAAAAVPALLKTLHDPETDVRFWSAYALGEIGDPRAIPDLQEAATRDHAVARGFGSVADEAHQALQQISSR